MPETESFAEEEILHGPEAEQSREYFSHDEAAAQPESPIERYEDEIVAALVSEKGGSPEDWELTYRGEGQYAFNGTEVINLATKESLGTELERAAGASGENIAWYQEMISRWQFGEDSIFRNPDYREIAPDGTGYLYVTHMILGPDGSVSYEIHRTETGVRGDERHSVDQNETEQGRVRYDWLEESSADTIEESREEYREEMAAALAQEGLADAQIGTEELASLLAGDRVPGASGAVEIAAQPRMGTGAAAASEMAQQDRTARPAANRNGISLVAFRRAA